MSWLKPQIAVGLDIGQTATKLVVLRRGRDGVRVLHAGLFRNREEGILNEDELAGHLGPWVSESGYDTQEVVLGIPQFLAIAQLSDFPVGIDRQLEEMVAYETQHLAGLSDEAFLHGYHHQRPFHVYENPVLIGICRESVIQTKLELTDEADLRVADLGMGGVALANAFNALLPDREIPDEKLELVLDIGAENSAYVLLIDRRILYVGSVLFGGDMFTHAVSNHLMLSATDAEKAKRTCKLVPSDTQSPVTQTAGRFAVELRQALEHWRSQSEHNNIPVGHVYISGGGALLDGLPAYLGSVFECPVTSFGVPGPVDAAEQGLLPIAYGLALQEFAQDSDVVRVSLAPENVRWLTRRRRRLPFLRVAVGLFATLTVGLLVFLFVGMDVQSKRLAVEKDRLQTCESLIPGLQDMQREAKHIQSMLIPFVAVGNRNRVFVQSIDILGRHQQPEDWLVYVCDELSYETADTGYIPKEAEDMPAPSMLFNPLGGSSTSRDGEVEEEHAMATDVRPWRYLVAAGFTPRRDDNPLGNIRATVDALNKSGDSVFDGVDILPNVEQPVYLVMRPWLERFRMKPYFVKLPLKQIDYTPEAVQ